MKNKITTETFIEKAQLIHGDKYDYRYSEYVGSKDKIIIICSIHGEFYQTPNKHLHGQGCPKCVGLNKSTNDFINEAKKTHNDWYDYSHVEYAGATKIVKIICPIHGLFEQTPDKHLHSCGCSKCGYLNSSIKQAQNVDEFIKKSNLIHYNEYDYSQVHYVNAKTKVKIICNKHGAFEQTPTNHLSGKGCSICKKSKGELIIRNFLLKKMIKFEQNKTFQNCKNIFLLSFDFYLPDNNMLIEFDGLQHFKAIDYYGGDMAHQKQKINDEIKNNFAKENNINLIRIPYMKINNIEQILNNVI